MDGALSWELIIGAYGYGSIVLPNLADFLLRNYNICTKKFERANFLKLTYSCKQCEHFKELPS